MYSSLSSEKNKNSERVRKRGGGRKKLEVEYPELQKWIEEIVWCFRANVLPHTSQKSCRSKAALAVLLVFCNHSQSKTLYQTKHMAIQKSYCCGQRKIQEAILSKYEVYISFKSIGVQLQKLGYSSQGNKKMLQVGEPHPDRNEQFEFINDMAKFMIFYGQPVISVDTKKKPSVISRMTERNTVRKTTREKYWIMISQ